MRACERACVCVCVRVCVLEGAENREIPTFYVFMILKVGNIR